MTALAQRRRRRTIAAALTATGLIALAAVMFVVGVITLANSREGEAVGIDTRPREVFPVTPNGLLAVTDDVGRLASVVVLTLHPDGVGGSIVTMPLNSDVSAGFGLQRRPLNTSFDPADPESFVASVEDMLSVSFERFAVLDPAGLQALLEPVGDVQVVLPDAVIDSDAIDPTAVTDDDAPVPGVVVSAGPQVLSPEDAVVVLTAIDEAVAADVQHSIDVAMWEAIAATAPTQSLQAPLDADGRPIAPVTMQELLARLLSGEVGVRDIASNAPGAAVNPTAADVVVLDRFDSTLVFAQISPALVSTPNPGLKVRVEAQFTDEQVAQTQGLFETSSDVGRAFIGQMLFLQNNVVSADTSPVGAPEVTVIVVTDPRRVAETEAAAQALFGDAEVRVAETVLDGVDLEVTLGMSYLIRETARLGRDAGQPPDDTSVPPPSDTVVIDG